MGLDTLEVAVRAARWVGRVPTDPQVDQLERYHDWILAEAIKAGGLGPNEEERIWSRHIADSLVFGTALYRAKSCIDVGSGVGLPGIPLAVMHPEIEFLLVDRSGRRCDLIRRAIALVGVENCSVSHRDLAEADSTVDAVVSRAAIPIEPLMIHVKRLLSPDGVAVVGLSRSSRPTFVPKQPPGWSSSIVTVPTDILDTAVYFLRIGTT